MVRALDEQVRHLDGYAGRRRPPDGSLTQTGRVGLERRLQAGSKSWVARRWNSALASSYSKMAPPSVSASSLARATTVLKHVLQVQAGADRPGDVAERLKLLHAVLELLEESDVLDGDDRLVRERRDQFDLLVRERLDVTPTEEEHADQGPSLSIGTPRAVR